MTTSISQGIEVLPRYFEDRRVARVHGEVAYTVGERRAALACSVGVVKERTVTAAKTSTRCKNVGDAQAAWLGAERCDSDKAPDTRGSRNATALER